MGEPERRRAPRFVDHLVTAVRIRPGYDAHVIDVSVAGLQIETGFRLLPGTSIELYVAAIDAGTRIARGRVVRSAVADLRAASIRYRGAICFDRTLPWLVIADPGG